MEKTCDNCYNPKHDRDALHCTAGRCMGEEWQPMTQLDTPTGSEGEPITDDTAVVEVTRDSSSIPIKERGCGNCANKDNPLWRCEVCSPLNRNGLDYPTQWEPIPTPKSCDDCALYNGSYGEIDCAECVNKSEWVENIWLSENLPPEIKPSNIEDRRTWGETETGTVRNFDTGATRDTDEGKHDYEGFYSPLVMERFAEYMTVHRTQSDGGLRDSDNWQKGIPKDAYMKSAWRHFMDLWKEHRGIDTKDGLEDALCALLFNVQGYLFETLKEKNDA